MDSAASDASSIHYHGIVEKTIDSLVPSPVTYRKRQHLCIGNASPGEFPLAAKPSIVLHLLANCNLDPQDLAKLEATCSFFREAANFAPDHVLSLAELAAFDMCQKRAIFKPMTLEQRENVKQMCGGSWKLVLRFLLAGETCTRRERSQAIAGPGHSIVVTSDGAVYSFGCGVSGQLGLGTTNKEPRPCLIKSLQGICIIHAAVGDGRTMLTSDTGRVYAFGTDSFVDSQFARSKEKVSTPQLIKSLKDVFVIQTTIGNLFTAVLSREGKVYTISWGDENKLGHKTDPYDVEPRLLIGMLEDTPVVQISAGYCYLLSLAWQPSGMSVYSVGCGMGGKLGHGDSHDQNQPRLIERFQELNFEPVVVAAGAWHAAAVGKDGRVCTWGWGHYGCLGHGSQNYEEIPKVVEALSNVKAVHVAAGAYRTSVIADNGDVYFFGCGRLSSLGLNPAAAAAGDEVNGLLSMETPELATAVKELNERVVQMSLTRSINWISHTLALTDSNKLYAFGAGNMGQLGIKLAENEAVRVKPELVDIDLG